MKRSLLAFSVMAIAFGGAYAGTDPVTVLETNNGHVTLVQEKADLVTIPVTATGLVTIPVTATGLVTIQQVKQAFVNAPESPKEIQQPLKEKFMLKGHSRGGGAYGVGQSIVSIGYGYNVINGFLGAYASESGASFSSFGPLCLKYEYGVTEKIGIGGTFTYSSGSVSWPIQDINPNTGNPETYQGTEKLTWLSVMVRANYHFVNTDKLDVYAGIGVGYNSLKFSYSDNDPNDAGSAFVTPNFLPVSYEGSIGLRYYFTPNIGVYGEVGYGVAYIQAGLAIKF